MFVSNSRYQIQLLVRGNIRLFKRPLWVVTHNVTDRPEADIRLAPGLTGNADPQEFLHSRAVDPPCDKKFAHDGLHPREILIEERGHTLYRIGHDLLLFLLREIIVLSNRAPEEFLLISPSIAKDKLANCCNRTRVIQVDPVNVSGSQQIVLSGKTTTRYQRAYRIELTGSGPWDIRLRRLTPDSMSVGISGATATRFSDAMPIARILPALE